jgi:hypothetical protein
MVIDLHFESVMHRHPFFARLKRNADEHSRIVVLVPHPVHDVDHAITDLAARPIEQAHSTVSVN